MTVAEAQAVVEEAHRQATGLTGNQLAEQLQDLLGQKLVAYALGDRHPKTIGRYARGERLPDDAAVTTLVDLSTIAGILEHSMRRETVKTWMLGSNPRLRGKAPIALVHEGKADKVIAAAKAYVTGR